MSNYRFAPGPTHRPRVAVEADIIPDPHQVASECMNRTIILMVINTVFNDMIVPSIIIRTPLPIWSSQLRIRVSAPIFMFH